MFYLPCISFSHKGVVSSAIPRLKLLVLLEVLSIATADVGVVIPVLLSAL